MDYASLPAVQKAHDLNLWLLRWAARVPRAYKFTLGDRVQTTAIDLYLALVEASHLRAKERVLFRANRLLDQLRLLLRLAHDLQVLSARQHAFVVEHHEELGRMIGGWLRHASGDGRGGMA